MIDNILREETYNGIVRDVIRDEEGVYVRVTIFDDKRHDRIEEVFPLDLFENWVPEINSTVKYHALQLKNGEYDGYFERGEERSLKLEDFDQRDIKKLKKYFKLR